MCRSFQGNVTFRDNVNSTQLKYLTHEEVQLIAFTLSHLTLDQYYEIQCNELEAIRSIYMDDFTDLTKRKSSWDKQPQIIFEITLRSVDKEPVEGVFVIRR